MLDLMKELKQPMEDEGWIVKVLIGSALSLATIKWFLFPLILFSYGYIYRIFVDRFRMEGSDRLPEWNGWKELFLKGLVIFLIVLGYFILPWFSYALSHSVYMGGKLAKLVAMIFFAGTAFTVVAAFFFLPMGIAQYTRNEKFSSAFALKENWDKIMNIGDDYFKITLLGIVSTILLTVISAIPFLGILLTAPLGFYTGLVLASLFGQVCREAFEELEEAHAKAEIT